MFPFNIDKNSQQNTSKANSVTYKKDYTPGSNGIYPRNTRLAEYMVYCIEEQKKHDYHNRYKKN